MLVDNAHVYGEMTPTGFRQFAQYVNLTTTTTTTTTKEVFVDLGSGVGSLVIQAALEFGVQRSIGVELSLARHEAAVHSYQMLTTPTTTTTRDINVVTFVHGDAADGHVVGRFLAEATVVWISNLLFDDALNRKLARVLEQYAGPHLRVIATLKPLLSSGGGDISSSIKDFELQPFKVPFEMSWNTGIHNQHEYYHHHHQASSWQQQQQQSSQSSSASSSWPGHFCSILLRYRP